MTDDEIIACAQNVVPYGASDAWQERGGYVFRRELLAFARAIEAATIERCAKVCDRRSSHMRQKGATLLAGAAAMCAEDIRALLPQQEITGEKRDAI